MQDDSRLRTGVIVTVPASYRVPGCNDRQTTVVQSVSPDGLWITDVTGLPHSTAVTEVTR